MKIDFIVMAAGNSRRFGSNKLLYPIGNHPMYYYVLEHVEEAVKKLEQDKELLTECRIFVVTQYEEILQEVAGRSEKNEKKWWQPGVFSPESIHGASYTVKNAIKAAGRESDYYMFLTADQPCMKASTLVRLVMETYTAGKGIGSMCWQDQPGNPVLFGNQYLKELLSLEGDKGGRAVVRQHIADCYFCKADEKWELADADTKKSMQDILDYFIET